MGQRGAGGARMVDIEGWELTLRADPVGDAFCPRVEFRSPYDVDRYAVADLVGRPLEELYDPVACYRDPTRCLDELEDRLRAAMRALRAEQRLRWGSRRSNGGR